MKNLPLYAELLEASSNANRAFIKSSQGICAGGIP